MTKSASVYGAAASAATCGKTAPSSVEYHRGIGVPLTKLGSARAAAILSIASATVVGGGAAKALTANPATPGDKPGAVPGVYASAKASVVSVSVEVMVMVSVEAFEHGANSAICIGDPDEFRQA